MRVSVQNTKGEGAVDLLVALRVRDVLGEGALVHVQRRDAEVAVHHAEALVRQQQRRPPRLPLQSKQPQDAPRLRQLGSELCLSSKHCIPPQVLTAAGAWR